ncbi:MAG: polysaccharide biosynthesis C-terminal domain-containing protein [Sedimentisphaerales bacterium]
MLNRIKKQLVEGKTLLLFGFLKGLVQVVPLIIAKFFSEDMFGTYSLAKMVIFFFIALLITTPQTPFVVFASRERVETGKINKFFSIQAVFFVFGIVFYAVMAVIFNSPIRRFAGISAPDLICMSLGFAGIALSSFLSNLFLALGQRVKNSLSELAYGVIMLAIIIGLAATGMLSIQTIFLTYLVSSIITLLIFAGTIPWGNLLPFNFSITHFREMFDFTKWVFIGATAIYFIDWGDNAILKVFNISTADIGQYSFGYQIFNGLVTMIYVLNSYFLPFVSENVHDSGRMRDYLYSKRPRILLFGLAILTAVFFACPYAFQIIYKGSYHSSVNILRILLIGCALMLYNTFYIPLFNALQLYKFLQTTNVVIMVIKVALNILLVLKYGFYGAAVGTVISYFCITAIYEGYYQIKIKRLINEK